MIEAIHFKNFKALRDTTLPLGPLTLIVGPNGSGKTTALEALGLGKLNLGERQLTAGVPWDDATRISIEIEWGGDWSGSRTRKERSPRRNALLHRDREGQNIPADEFTAFLTRARVYALDARALARPVELAPNIEMASDGGGLAGVLDRLRDEHPERWDALNAEFTRWLPEFDRILFRTPEPGRKEISLRMRTGGHLICAADGSQGTLLALAMLTLAYLPEPPPVIGLEEPDRGLHPRLLRDVRDAMYRLAYPASVGEERDPVQVVATTHSPYMLDLFRDHLEEIVIAAKVEGNVEFQKLSQRPEIEEILGSAPLGEVWYSGILGGVPAER